MRDQPLTLLDIMERDIPHTEFGFLSACHTAVCDEKTPDEVTHLAVGLRFSGFRSIAGTLWEGRRCCRQTWRRSFLQICIQSGGWCHAVYEVCTRLYYTSCEIQKCHSNRRWFSFISVCSYFMSYCFHLAVYLYHTFIAVKLIVGSPLLVMLFPFRIHIVLSPTLESFADFFNARYAVCCRVTFLTWAPL